MRIRIFPSRIQGHKDPVSGSASKNLNIFNPKNCFQALGKVIWDVRPGSGFFPGIKKTPDPQHWHPQYSDVPPVPVNYGLVLKLFWRLF
jgi:hypothetical protein